MLTKQHFISFVVNEKNIVKSPPGGGGGNVFYVGPFCQDFFFVFVTNVSR